MNADHKTAALLPFFAFVAMIFLACTAIAQESEQSRSGKEGTGGRFLGLRGFLGDQAKTLSFPACVRRCADHGVWVDVEGIVDEEADLQSLVVGDSILVDCEALPAGAYSYCCSSNSRTVYL